MPIGPTIASLWAQLLQQSPRFGLICQVEWSGFDHPARFLDSAARLFAAYWLVLTEARSWVGEVTLGDNVTVVDAVTAVGCTCR